MPLGIFGVVTSKKGEFSGLRLHATMTTNQLIDELLSAPAAFSDRKVVCASLENSYDLVLVADEG